MHRIEALEIIVQVRGNDLIVCNIGDPSRELFSVRDAPNQFYMLGSMGMASSIGLGIALARPDRSVVAIDGDGAVLMNLGTLATIADQRPENYLLVIIDNGVYGSTGGQPTCTARMADLASIATGAGMRDVRVVRNEDELRSAFRSMASGVLVIRVDTMGTDGPIIDIPTRQIVDRFMAECQRLSM
ncbi:MAG: sulfopyruvate decarboxylase subunit beta [Methanomassiliicoccales archaeon]